MGMITTRKGTRIGHVEVEPAHIDTVDKTNVFHRLGAWSLAAHLRGARTADQGRPDERTKPMLPRLPFVALAGALALAGGQARAADAARGADLRAVDTYLAITGAAGSPTDGHAAAAAAGLSPLDARVVALGEAGALAVVYFTYDEAGADTVHVVTTVATGPDGASTPARFVSRLAPGQRAEVAVAVTVDAGPDVLELAYDGDLLTVRSVTAQPEG